MDECRMFGKGRQGRGGKFLLHIKELFSCTELQCESREVSAHILWVKIRGEDNAVDGVERPVMGWLTLPSIPTLFTLLTTYTVLYTW